MPSLPSALDRFDEIAGRAAGRATGLFLDYDGTLTPIVERPELAVLSDGMRETVEELTRHFPVAVLSGRDRADVERLVALPGIVYAGSHGFDIAGPNGLTFRHEKSEELLPALERAERALRPLENRLEGVIVERKAFSISVHFRLLAGGDRGKLESAVADVAAREPSLVRADGKMLWELRPGISWDKGRAITWLLERMGPVGSDVYPIAIGDDVTDEDAFRAVALSGTGIIVGAPADRPTLARYALAGPEEVLAFLLRLIERSR